jgi:hypothetical protein
MALKKYFTKTNGFINEYDYSWFIIYEEILADPTTGQSMIGFVK